jgi:hypothetical protein
MVIVIVLLSLILGFNFLSFAALIQICENTRR